MRKHAVRLDFKIIPEGFSLLNNRRLIGLYSSIGSSFIGRPEKLYRDFFQPKGNVENENGQL
jgi:hypothetical protein